MKLGGHHIDSHTPPMRGSRGADLRQSEACMYITSGDGIIVGMTQGSKRLKSRIRNVRFLIQDLQHFFPSDEWTLRRLLLQKVSPHAPAVLILVAVVDLHEVDAISDEPTLPWHSMEISVALCCSTPCHKPHCCRTTCVQLLKIFPRLRCPRHFGFFSELVRSAHHFGL